ncbi:MAG: CotH kinase family protein [Emticicia sp.]|nr:CotH kinase family protein [Emticicia sp.]
MRIKLLLFLFVICCQVKLTAQVISGIYINEVMASNETTIADSFGEYSDWIELYNANGSSVDLANYYMSDDASNLTKFRFTSTAGQVVIPANGLLIIWASGVISRGTRHTNFSLSASGEAIVLTAPNGTTLIDGFSFGKQRTDVSYGRLPNGGVDFKYFSPSSPNASNNSANAYIGILEPPIFSHSGGFYSSPFSLSISHTETGASIYYTNDGSIPNPANLIAKSYSYRNSYPYGESLMRSYSSNLYSSPISIISRANVANQISKIRTNHTYSSSPSSVIYKGTVIQSRVYKDGYLPSDPVTHTFFFTANGKNKYSLPVISIVSQEDGLFSHSNGIYVPGADFENWKRLNGTESPNGGTPANYWRKGETAERSATFELIEQDTVVLKKNIDIRINGGWSRANFMKSLRVYFPGDGLDYKIYPEHSDKNYKTLILRNSGNDFGLTHFRDAVIQETMKGMRMPTQKYRPSIVFLNGEYWGIHNIRERYDADYFNRVYGVDANNIDLLEYTNSSVAQVDNGTATHFNAMNDYISENSMSNATNYNYIKTQMDIDNYIDYNVAEIYCLNKDWPHNNIQFWREKVTYNPNTPTAYGRDGRWRWTLFDTDFGYGLVGNASENAVDRLFIDDWSTNMFSRLTQNTEFRNAFINRFADLLNTSFLPSRVNVLIDNMRAGILSSINEHNSRWNLSNWEGQISSMRSFVQQRPAYQRTHIRSKWGISGEYNLTVNVSNAAHGYVKVNTVDILPTTPGVSANPYPWAGSYFNNIPIQIRPRAKQGYKFKHWVYNSTILTDSVQTITTSSARSYTAVFELYITSPNPTPTAANLATPCGYKFGNWDSASGAGTSPSSMKFVYMADVDPNVSSTISGFTTGLFNLTTRTRINGLGENGFSFINTGNTNGNVGYPGIKLGGAILALNTLNVSNVSVSWVGRTIVANSRVYRVRLQYRIGDIQPFNDLLDNTGQVVEYIRGASGTFTQMPEVNIPTELLNQPYVQLLWRYYYTGVQNDINSGARDELGIDDIIIKSEKILSGNSSTGSQTVSFNTISSSSNVSLSNPTTYQAGNAVILTPGFQTGQNTVFTAQIIGCQ